MVPGLYPLHLDLVMVPLDLLLAQNKVGIKSWIWFQNEPRTGIIVRIESGWISDFMKQSNLLAV